MLKQRSRIALFLVVLMMILAFAPASAAATGSIKVTRVAITALEGKKELCLDKAGGDIIELTAIVYPETHSQIVEWKSSNTEVATVDNGIVTPHNAGYAYISAQAEGSTMRSSYRVDVRPLPEKIMTTVTPLYMALYKSLQLKASVYPTVAARGIVWSSNNLGVVTVTQTGVVKAVGGGSTFITMSSAYDSDVEITREIIVLENALRSVKFSPTSYTNIPVGFSVALDPIPTPVNADFFENPDDYTFTWITSNDRVLKVDDGTVTAVGPGSAYITLITPDGKRATCRFTVKDRPNAIFINGKKDYEAVLAQGKTTTLKITTDPKGAANAVTWTSSNTDLMTVDHRGVVKAVVSGAQNAMETVVITAQAAAVDGFEPAEATATFTIVYANVKNIRLRENHYYMVEGQAFNLTDHVTITPADADITDYTVKSSRPAVATFELVNGEPILTAVKHGTSVITVRSVDGGRTDTATVHVQKQTTP